MFYNGLNKNESKTITQLFINQTKCKIMCDTLKNIYGFILFFIIFDLMVISSDYLIRKLGLTVFTYIIYPFITAYKLFMHIMRNEPVQLSIELTMVVALAELDTK